MKFDFALQNVAERSDNKLAHKYNQISKTEKITRTLRYTPHIFKLDVEKAANEQQQQQRKIYNKTTYNTNIWL